MDAPEVHLARRGRPARTTVAAIARAAIEIGLDTFTMTQVATRIGVAEGTLYNYVAGREALHAIAAAQVFADLDVRVDTAEWTEYVDAIGARAVELARRHPGLRDYLLYGPYEPSTVQVFEALHEQVRVLRPDVGEDEAFMLVSRPVVVSLGSLGDPVLEPAEGWLRRAVLAGFEAMLERDERPPMVAGSWRTKLAGRAPTRRS